MNSSKYTRQRGSVLITVALSLVVLIAFLGLALDSGAGYLTKAKLSSAVDGAVLAAGGAVARGSSEEEQKANAIDEANAFFRANYPAGTLSTQSSLATPSVVFQPDGSVDIALSAEAKRPVWFMRVLGFRNQTVRTSATVTRRPIDMVMVSDSSVSLVSSGNWDMVHKENIKFFEALSQVQDRAALIFFANAAEVAVPFNGDDRGFDMANIRTQLDWGGSTGGTATYAGMAAGFDQLTNVITSPSPSRFMVVFTDGVANIGLMGDDLVDYADSIRDAGIYVFVIGFGDQVKRPERDYLKRLANTTDSSSYKSDKLAGQYCDSKDQASLAACYSYFSSQMLKMTQ